MSSMCLIHINVSTTIIIYIKSDLKINVLHEQSLHIDTLADYTKH